VTERRLRRLILGLTLVGIAVAGYLSYVHFAGIKALCVPGGGCEKVQESRWAWVNGQKNGFLPVAYLGLGGYIAILGSLFVRGENGRFLTAALALPGWAFSAYLTYNELVNVKAVCWWCMGSFTLITLIAVLSTWRLLRGDIVPAPEETSPA
jgi:uncharacterized membrane protein